MIKVVELFAGIGAYSKALEKLNIPHKVELAVEMDAKTIESYNLIHNANFKPLDITTLDEKEVPDCDIICYSPPCQAFSSAGKKLGFDDTRGILFFDALRIIKEKKPKIAIMENVKGLPFKFSNEFQCMLEELELAGYVNHWQILNAKDYNIPQNRERVFVVSIRKDIKLDFTFPNPIELTNILSNNLNLNIPHEIDYVKGCSLRTRAYLGLPQRLELRKDEVSNSITTVKKDSMIAIKVKEPIEEIPLGYQLINEHLTREIDLQERFLLMGFNLEDYQVLEKMPKTKLAKMSGNSIVVNVIENIFKQIFK